MRGFATRSYPPPSMTNEPNQIITKSTLLLNTLINQQNQKPRGHQTHHHQKWKLQWNSVRPLNGRRFPSQPKKRGELQQHSQTVQEIRRGNDVGEVHVRHTDRYYGRNQNPQPRRVEPLRPNTEKLR